MSDTERNLKLEKSDGDIVDLIIDKKISDATLDVAKDQIDLLSKLIKILLAFGVFTITILGIFVPLYSIHRNELKLDKAITNMKSEFDKIAGKALRKPEITGYIDGKALFNNVIDFNFNKKDLNRKYIAKQIVLKNTGDGTAENISILLYLKSDYKPLHRILEVDRGRFVKSAINDKSEFDTVYRLSKDPFVLPAQDSFPIRFVAISPNLIKHDTEIIAILKIFYGEPTAQEIPFSIEIKNK
jgi:hypothetical protein